MSGVRDFIPPFVDVLADRLPHANPYDANGYYGDARLRELSFTGRRDGNGCR